MSQHYVADFNPTIFTLGPLEVRWYGLMYVVSFIIAGFLLRRLIQKKFLPLKAENADSIMTIHLIGMFLGARLAYVFIYNWGYYQNHLGDILAVWKGGLSFHGALVGLVLGGYYCAYRYKFSWGLMLDVVALCATPGLFFGRIGNFINGELYGRVTDHWVGMVFPHGGPYARHPSQLYEAFLEGFVLSLILWLVLFPRVKTQGLIGSAFLIGYGLFRYLVEFFRQPDPQLGYYFWGTTTMGQILCLLMIIAGAIYLAVSLKKPIALSHDFLKSRG